MERRRIGLVVNPVAGLGGKFALKGTDGAALARALERGASPVAPERARRAILRLAASGAEVDLIAGAGSMGQDSAVAAGLAPVLVLGAAKARTSAEDTRAMAEEMAGLGLDLVLFAGGDGTARDVFDALGGRLPILGIPSGVKMHSAVFATSPEAAGELAASFVRGQIRVGDAEIMDIDEEALCAGRLSAQLYGHARVPLQRRLVQGPKLGATPDSDGELAALCDVLAAEAEPGRLLILGPGTTIARVKARLGIDGTLAGIDVVRGRVLAAKDADEARIMALLDAEQATALPPQVIVGVVGGQGFLFGRGNQPLGPQVLRRVGRSQIVIAAAAEKILSLDPPSLRVDTGDLDTDRWLQGHVGVRTGPKRTLIVKVTA
ncbi:MAG: ATP-NAD kinase family protein [Alphaproteobacteria bacterium]